MPCDDAIARLAADIIRSAVSTQFSHGQTLKDWNEYRSPALSVADRLVDAGLLVRDAHWPAPDPFMRICWFRRDGVLMDRRPT